MNVFGYAAIKYCASLMSDHIKTILKVVLDLSLTNNTNFLLFTDWNRIQQLKADYNWKKKLIHRYKIFIINRTKNDEQKFLLLKRYILFF